MDISRTSSVFFGLATCFALACGSDAPSEARETPAQTAAENGTSEAENGNAESAGGEGVENEGENENSANDESASAAGEARSTRRQLPRLSSEQRATASRLRREARVAARAQNWSEAWTKIQSALEINPASSRLRCEAGFIAFRAGETATAGRLVQQAWSQMGSRGNVPEPLRVPRAMCLYNVGLVLEAQGDVEGARAAFEQSITLRPNATVQRRLDGLPSPSPEDEAPEWDRDELLGWWCSDGYAGDMARDFGEEECNGEVDERPVPDAPEGSVIVELFALSDMSEGLQETFVAIVDGQAFPVCAAYNPGALGITAGCELSDIRYEDVLPGGAAEFVMTVVEYENDDDMGGCESTGGETTATFVCSADFDEVKCTTIASTEMVYFMSEQFDECESSESEDMEDGYRSTLRFSEGRVFLDDFESLGDNVTNVEREFSLREQFDQAPAENGPF